MVNDGLIVVDDETKEMLLKYGKLLNEHERRPQKEMGLETCFALDVNLSLYIEDTGHIYRCDLPFRGRMK